MFGKSIYLSSMEHFDFDRGDVDIYFTSFHIMEEFSKDYAQRAKEMLCKLKNTGKKIMADISPRGLTALGYASLEEFVRETEIDIVRCDFGIEKEEMLKASKYCALAVNASTLDYEIASMLKKTGADVWAVHNFYPRPETGLDEEFFSQRNHRLRELGIKIAAFITGEGALRGPLFEGLPTLEAHRNLPPFLQYVQMKETYKVDMVLVGDPHISSCQMEWIQRLKKEHMLSIPVMLDTKYQHLYGKVWTIREDSPKWIARLNESRGYAAIGEKIKPEQCKERKAGSITIDNEKYLRYSGEIQIMRENLKADERVNVIGNINPEYQAVLSSLERGKKIIFV